MINGVKAIIREVWALPTEFPSEGVTAFARELRDRVRRGDAKKALYTRASLDDRFHESCHKRGIHLSFRAPMYAPGALR